MVKNKCHYILQPMHIRRFREIFTLIINFVSIKLVLLFWKIMLVVCISSTYVFFEVAAAFTKLLQLRINFGSNVSLNFLVCFVFQLDYRIVKSFGVSLRNFKSQFTYAYILHLIMLNSLKASIEIHQICKPMKYCAKLQLKTKKPNQALLLLENAFPILLRTKCSFIPKPSRHLK